MVFVCVLLVVFGTVDTVLLVRAFAVFGHLSNVDCVPGLCCCFSLYCFMFAVVPSGLVLL